MTMPLSQQCTATKKNGKRCSAQALPARDVCVTHVRGALPVNEIDVLKSRLLSLTKSKNPRVAANAALTLGRLLAKFPPKSSTAQGSDLDLRKWTPDERARLSVILKQMKALNAEVTARLDAEDAPPITATVPLVTPSPMEAPGVEPASAPVAPSPTDLVAVMTANGPQRLTRHQLADGWRVQ